MNHKLIFFSACLAALAVGCAQVKTSPLNPTPIQTNSADSTPSNTTAAPPFFTANFRTAESVNWTSVGQANWNVGGGLLLDGSPVQQNGPFGAVCTFRNAKITLNTYSPPAYANYEMEFDLRIDPAGAAIPENISKIFFEMKTATRLWKFFLGARTHMACPSGVCNVVARTFADVVLGSGDHRFKIRLLESGALEAEIDGVVYPPVNAIAGNGTFAPSLSIEVYGEGASFATCPSAALAVAPTRLTIRGY